MNPLLKRIRRLKSLLRRRGASREDAEDLVQEAFVRLAAYCNEGNKVRYPEAFLKRTVMNLAFDAHAIAPCGVSYPLSTSLTASHSRAEKTIFHRFFAFLERSAYHAVSPR